MGANNAGSDARIHSSSWDALVDDKPEIIPTSDRGIRRFNDGGVDAAGRFWLAEIDVKAMPWGAGNIPKDYTPIGRLWRYDPDGTLTQMESGLACGNGIGWSPDNKTSACAGRYSARLS